VGNVSKSAVDVRHLLYGQALITALSIIDATGLWLAEVPIYQRLAKYIVISKPKRTSIAVGVSHFMQVFLVVCR